METGQYIIHADKKHALHDRYLTVRADGTAVLTYERNDIISDLTPKYLAWLLTMWQDEMKLTIEKVS